MGLRLSHRKAERLCQCIMESVSSSQDLFSICSFCLTLTFGPVAVIAWRVAQTAVVWEIISRTRCKAPDLINYTSVGVITAHGIPDVRATQTVKRSINSNTLQHTVNWERILIIKLYIKGYVYNVLSKCMTPKESQLILQLYIACYCQKDNNDVVKRFQTQSLFINTFKTQQETKYTKPSNTIKPTLANFHAHLCSNIWASSSFWSFPPRLFFLNSMS